MLANPVMIKAYAEGIPEMASHSPDGAKIAKILGKPKTIMPASFSTEKPDEASGALSAVGLMEKDTK